MGETYSFDRREGDICVLVGDDGGVLNLPVADLPDGAEPGDLIRVENGALTRLPDETEIRRRQVLALQRRLRRRNN